MNHLLRQVRNLFAGAAIPWAICGGYALELFAGHAIRSHGDVDICVFEEDRDQIIAFLLENGWKICEFRGMGKVRPIHDPAHSEQGRNLMAFLSDCPLVQFYPCDEEGLLYHHFSPTGMETLNYIDLLFSRTEGDRLLFGSTDIARERSRAILIREGFPFLAPEIALLHKAANANDLSAQQDHAIVAPLLSAEQQQWLQTGLAALYPQGHPWRQV